MQRPVKGQRGEADILSILIMICLFLGLITGIGPCRKLFYGDGERAPLQVQRYEKGYKLEKKEEVQNEEPIKRWSD